MQVLCSEGVTVEDLFESLVRFSVYYRLFNAVVRLGWWSGDYLGCFFVDSFMRICVFY